MLSGKIALVTGAGRGIGRGCALELARAGADVVANDRPDSSDLAGLVTEIEALGRKCVGIAENAFSRAGCQSIFEQSIEAMGSIDILISNPAFSQRAPFSEYPEDLWEQTLKGTLTAGFHMSQIVSNYMVERGMGGKITFISSVQGELPAALSVAYNAAKAGVNHMMRTIAMELCQHRINVNAIAPGWIDTPGERLAFTEEQIREEGAQLPWGRVGRPEEIGKAAAFLSSSAADYITATVLPVGGGFRYRQEFNANG
ncbi:MAG: SDR family oxidoreductase [Planctomycetaceae bacterium]|nr:SDR family oxidoreductase [Planctomycetaceae bacterium]